MPSPKIAAALGNLNIDDKIKSRKEAELAERWEDEVSDDGISTPIRPSTANVPRPPPPTPASPTEARKRDLQYQNFGPLSYDEAPSSPGGNRSDVPERRPDKTTAVASRLIAAGLGQRAPKRTPEQREYDQAMKVQEKRNRDQAKAEEEKRKQDAEAAKKAIWDD